MKKIYYFILICFCLFLIFFSDTGHAEEYEYDKLDRLVKVTYEDGSYVTYEYDANGNITNTYVYDVSEDSSENDSEEPEEETSDKPDIPNQDNQIIITGISSEYIYNGKAFKPVPMLYDKNTGTYLKENIDYSVSYKNTTNAYVYGVGDVGFVTKKAPTVVIKGKGNFMHEIHLYFKINPRSLADYEDELLEMEDMYVDAVGRVVKKAPGLKFDGKKMNRKYYDVFYPSMEDGAYKDPGTYSLEIVGKGNFIGKRTINYVVVNKNTNLSYAKIKKIPNQIFDGVNPVILAEDVLVVSYKVNGKNVILNPGEHYSVEYKNNNAIGTCIIKISAIEGCGYSGYKTTSFKIKGQSIQKAKVEGIQDYVYSGKECKPQLRIVLDEELVKDKDYSVSYSNNINAGKAKVLITGIGKYEGTIKKTFTITPANINDVVSVSDGEITEKYIKGGAKPTLNLMFNHFNLIQGEDYTISYKNNKKIYTYVPGDIDYSAKAAPVMTIKGKKNFKGKIDKTFIISGRGLADKAVSAKISVVDMVVSNKKGGYISKIVVKDADGKVLKINKDYTAPIYSLINEYGEKIVLDKNDIVPAGSTIQVSITGLGSYYDENDNVLSENYRIVLKKLSSVKVNNIQKLYTGKEIMLSEEDFIDEKGLSRIAIGSGKNKKELLPGRDFEIVDGTYANNINKGTATVEIRGIGTYGGVIKIKFKITAKSLSE